jgi:hypothetical protein
MIRNRILLKSIAVFLIIETLVNTVAPTISWALTAGPTAPEATSFEPVDMTDVVSLATGDLTYNVPLLEVPGPSGGYPISLSYHAGIQPNEEASWVGLGWVLNPGSVARNLSGFADDQLNDPNVSRFFWKGGETTTWETGVSIGQLGLASVDAGLSYSQDTYRGVGVGWYVGGGIGANIAGGSASLGVNATVGLSPYGDPYASAGVGLSAPLGKNAKEGLGLGMQAGVTTNFQTVEGFASASVSVRGNVNGESESLAGASISTTTSGQSRIGWNIQNGNFVNNSRAGRLSTSQHGVTIPFPIWYGVWGYVGKKYQRYWIDQLDDTQVSGSLNFPATAISSEWLDTHVYDTYRLLDPNLEGGIVDNPEPEKAMGGSFPDYDSYAVQAQGIGGLMRPHILQGHLVNRNNFEIRTDEDGDDYRYNKTVQYLIGNNTENVGFRFVSDFSNRYEYNPPTPVLNESGEFMDFSFSGSPVTGESGNDGLVNQRLIGSRHIEWFTNQEIFSKQLKVTQAGFIETRTTGFSRGSGTTAQYPDNIGGFVIINESGVKYHFALPAYAYQEYSYSTNLTNTDAFNEFKKPGHYAYTWFLTAVTGPDFVDRGADGTADGVLNEYDWGYWVEFDYGKWTDQYTWRNPSEGMAEDVDNNFRNFSEGKKEIYYLDAIRTKTHTALFVKDIRHDGKSTIYSYKNVSDGKSSIPGVSRKVKETITDITKQGGFIPKTIINTCVRNMGSDVDEGSITYVSRPTSVLKLNKILLLKNEDLPVSPDKSKGDIYKQRFEYTWNIARNENCSLPSCQECEFLPITFDHHLYQNVLDVHDVAENLYQDKALRVIQLNTDYSLSPETSNSFDYTLVNQSAPYEDDSDYTKHGKLTLKSVKFLGKGGADLMPAMNFGYDYPEPKRGSATLVKNADGRFSITSMGTLVDGDIIEFQSNGRTCYALVNEGRVKRLGKNIPVEGTIAWKVTKNPPYNKDHFDIWGLYKPDFDETLNNQNSDASRLVTPASAKNLDAWSLRYIVHATGASVDIEYEPDSYKKPVLAFKEQLRVKSVYQYENSNNYAIELYDDVADLDEIIDDHSTVEYSMLFADPYYLFPYKTFTHRVEVSNCIISSVFKNQAGNWILLAGDLSSMLAKRPNTAKTYGNPVFLSGLVSPSADTQNLGGGIRTRNITVNNGTSSGRTEYDYGLEGIETTGTTSYEPGNMDQVIFDFPPEGDPSYEYFDDEEKIKDAKKAFNKEVYGDFAKILANAREIPSPGVMYEFVTIREYVKKQPDISFEELPNYSRYHFQVYHEGMTGIVYSDDQTLIHNEADFITLSGLGRGRFALTESKSRNVAVKDYSAQVGTLKSITLYNGDGQKVSETINNYLYDRLPASPQDNDPSIEDGLEVRIENYEAEVQNAIRGQGVLEETFSEGRYVRQTGVVYNAPYNYPIFHLYGVISKREVFPAIQTGQTVINYKSGIKTESTNLAYDFYSGQVVKTLSQDGHGNSFITEVTPAYRKYPGMGFAISGGANMLVQEAASSVYKVDVNNQKIGLVAASAQTWTGNHVALRPGERPSETTMQSGIWRKQASYSFIGNDLVTLRDDGLYPAAQVPEFSAWNPGATIPEGWQMNGAITVYDVSSHALEASDINGDFAATKMSYDQTKVFATVANARYTEFAYSGAEERLFPGNQFGGGVFTGGGGITSNAHTGSRAVIAQAGSRGFTYSMDPYEKKYHVSVWSSQENAIIRYKADAGTPVTAVTNKVGKAGNWYLIEADIPAAGTWNQFEVWCQAVGATTYFDDFRIHPADAAMTSYVYNQWDELSHILDDQNLYTEFRYDGMGRLSSTHKESFQTNYGVNGIVKLSDIEYNYGANHPFIVSINATKTGTGAISPSGSAAIKYGGTQSFEIQELCSNPKLLKLLIDDQEISLNQSSLTLFDGTRVTINGRTVTFSNVQFSHTIHAQFQFPVPGGGIRCHQRDRCYTGTYDYYTYNSCGEEVWTYNVAYTSIPISLRPVTKPNCCGQNIPADNCSCTNPEQ